MKPDAAATEETLVLGSNVNGYQTAQVYFLPKDLIGNYLGPGFPGNFKVSLSSGQVIGLIKDIGNGIYLQNIRYLAKGPQPTITLELPGTNQTKTIGGEGELNICKILIVILLAIIIILVILLILCLIRKNIKAAAGSLTGKK